MSFLFAIHAPYLPGLNRKCSLPLMALLAALYSLDAVIAESGILPFCIPSASKQTGGLGKPLGIKKDYKDIYAIYSRKKHN